MCPAPPRLDVICMTGVEVDLYRRAAAHHRATGRAIGIEVRLHRGVARRVDATTREVCGREPEPEETEPGAFEV